MATAGVGLRCWRGGGEIGRLVHPSLPESSLGKANPCDLSSPTSQPASHDPPLPTQPVPVAGSRLLLTRLLRRPRTRTVTLLWNRGKNCQGEGPT